MKKIHVAGICLLVSVAGACGSTNVVHVAGGDSDGGLGAEDGGVAVGDGEATGDGSMGGDGGPPGAVGLTTNVKIIIEPNGNDASELVAAINGATKSVHVVMYLFSSTLVEDALVAKHNAGLDVKVMLNQTFPAGGSNAAIYASLQSKHVPVQWAPINLTHEKCIIIDGAVAWIMTMNTTQSSPTANREYLAIDKDLDDVVEAEAIFESDYANKPASVVGKLLVAPVNARERLIGLVNGATSTLDIEGEEFSDAQLTAAITARADAGVKVRLVLANVAPSAAQSAAIATLKQHKAHVVSVANPYIHAKAMVADGREMYVGSANFTAASLGYNRELGIITATASEVTAVASTIAQDFATGSPL